MKNMYKMLRGCYCHARSLLFVMKLTILAFFLGLMGVSASTYSQKTKLSLDLEDVSINDVLKKIESQSEFVFIYENEALKIDKKISINVSDLNVDKILSEVFEGTGINFEIVDKQIVLTKRSTTGTDSEPGAQEPQKKSVSGKITDVKGNTLPGVTVVVKGTTKGIITDTGGNFYLSNIPVNSTLQLSFIGMQSQEILFTGQPVINVVMKETAINLDDVVVIGYGTVRKPDLTGSVGSVSIAEMAKAPVSSFAEALAGRVAGVRASAVDGQPGSTVNITIRGTGSLTQSTTPLFVIDGIAVENYDPVTMNPEEIESMTVLKDASSTAIYGSRGANGVIVIQTKRGKEGKPVVSISSSVGFQMTPKPMAMMSPYEFIKYQQELNPDLASTRAFFANGKTLEDYRNTQGIDLQKYLLRTGSSQIHDISLRGGTDKTKYSISGSVFDQKGAIINTGLSRYSGRVTVDQIINNKVSAGITANYSVVKQNGQIINQGQVAQNNPTSFVLASAWMYRPISPFKTDNLLTDLFDADANTTSDIRINPLISQENQYLVNSTNLIEASAYISYKIAKNLTFKSTAGIRHNKYTTEAFYNSKTTQGSPYNLLNLNGINGSIRNALTSNISNSNTLNYSKSINRDHLITALALFETSSNETSIDGYSGRLLPNENLGINGIDEGVAYNALLSRSRSTLVSYAFRCNYNYKSKYLVTGTFRADASSKFPQNWGYFPSAAVAWNMQREAFFAKAFHVISTSKLRMGYGTTGNNRIGDFDYSPSLTFNNTTQGYAFYNSSPVGGVYVSNVGNVDLKWETVKTLDLGYELGLLKDRIKFEFDLYRKTTSDLLLRALLPPTTGFANAVKNIGELRNDGMEFTLNTFNINTSKFKWQTNFNISFNKNMVMALTSGQQNLGTAVSYVSQFGQPLYLAEIGKPTGMMIGYVWEGNYQYSDFNSPSPGVYVLKPEVAGNGAVRNTIQPGDIKYKDLNGDGTMTNADVTFIGRGQPIHTGGFSNNFSYMGFELNVFFQWSYGNDIYNANRLLLEGNSNNYTNINQFASYANRWSPENQTNENYRTRGQGPVGFHSSRVVEDGSYLRLKTVSLSYFVPSRYIKKVNMSSVSLNVSAQNLATWTNYSGMDPEVSTRGDVLTPGYDYSSYPKSPTVVFGIKASF